MDNSSTSSRDPILENINPLATTQTYFQNAHHFEMNDSQFIIANAANTTIVNNASSSDPVAATLRQYVAAGAIFDSAERYPPGKCYPGTRQKIIEKMKAWVDHYSKSEPILWLYGPAGAGKSALAQSICESLAQSHPESYGGSFFFAMGSTDRGNALKLFTTLSYQLAVHFPSVRTQINEALNRDPTLPTKSMESQLRFLVIKPLLHCRDDISQRPIIIIDGLDECADEGMDTQRKIITLIGKSVIEHDNLPLRFLVASRPEYWIRDAFNSAPLTGITQLLSLRDDVDADWDIKIYLIEEFKKIRQDNIRLMGSVDLPWPPMTVINHLVEEASGQYVYASTVLKFVGKTSRFSNPKHQLHIITSPGPQRASAFSELDRLYARILSAYPRWETMKWILGGLLAYRNTTIVKVFFDLDPDEIVLVLDALSSLIYIGNPEHLSTHEQFLESSYDIGSLQASRDAIAFCHLSFSEFLKDENRAGAFYIDSGAFRDEITRRFFGIIHRNIDQQYELEPHIYLNIERTTYHFVMDEVAFSSIWHSETDTLIPFIKHMSERLALPLQFYTARTMNSLICFTQDMRRLESSLEVFLEKRHIQHLGQSSSDESGNGEENFHTSRKKLQEAIFLAQKQAMYALTLLTEFKVSPLMVYLTEFYDASSHDWITPSDLSHLTNISGILSTEGDLTALVRQHRHIMSLSYFTSERRWSLRLANLKALLDVWHYTSPRIQKEWKEQRNHLAYGMIKTIFESPKSSFKSDDDKRIRYFMLKEVFFDSRNIRDLCSRDNLQNTCECLPLLDCIGDLENWTSLRKYMPEETIPDVRNFIISVIFWINRQMTDPQALQLLQAHNEDLSQRLVAIMKFLFDEFFLQYFSRSYNRKLCVKIVSACRTAISVGVITTLHPLPLPQGFHTEEGRYEYSNEDWHSENPDWHALHDELFGKMNTAPEGPRTSIIDPSCWHPHLASRLLNALVKFLYGSAYPKFSISKSWNNQSILKFKKTLSYINQCLPFALPTSENLDALRLVVYLYPHVVHVSTVAFLLPKGIWLAMAAFLQKYDRSALSSEEFGLFESWLYMVQNIQI